MAKKEKEGFFSAFKKFLFEGNAMSMAIGVIIGAAMKDLVTSLVDNIFSPIIGIFTGKVDFSTLSITVGDANIKYGAFITSLINFVILAFVVFLIVRIVNNINDKIKELSIIKVEAKEEEPTVKVCPYCQSEISIKATRCPHCTSVLEDK